MIVKLLIVVKGFELYASCGAVHQQHGSPVSAIGTQRGRMTALLIAATNQQSAHAGLSHLSECDFFLTGEGGHAPIEARSEGGVQSSYGLGLAPIAGISVFRIGLEKRSWLCECGRL
jgi:hypothetical protein